MPSLKKKKKKKVFDSIMEKGVVRIRDMADSRFYRLWLHAEITLTSSEADWEAYGNC